MKFSNKRIIPDKILHYLPGIFVAITLCGVLIDRDFADPISKLGAYVGIVGAIGLVVSILANLINDPASIGSPSKRQSRSIMRFTLVMLSLLLFGGAISYSSADRCRTNYDILHWVEYSGALAFALAVGLRFEARKRPENKWIRMILSVASGFIGGAVALYVVFYLSFLASVCWGF